MVDSLKVYLYKNKASFASYGMGLTTLPIDVANFVAFAKANEMHVNLEKVQETSWVKELPLLAHEYGHNIHFQIAGGKLRGTTWFAEGFGEWVAARVLDALGWQSYTLTLERAKRELVRHHELISGLSWLQDRQDWESVLQKPKGFVRTYSFAFVAVDRLIGKMGIAGVLQYMKSGDFEGSFGESPVAYKRDLTSFESGVDKPRGINPISRPNWKVGDQWTYQEQVPGNTTNLTKQIIREDFFQGMSTFVVTVNGEEEFYSKETLGLLATKRHGTLTTQRDKPNEFFLWPLKLSSEWKNTYNFKELASKKSALIDRMMFIPKVEDVKTAAGIFRSVKIEAYNSQSGRLDAEYWYSPTAKWFVRIRNYGLGDGFVREEQLLGFKFD